MIKKLLFVVFVLSIFSSLASGENQSKGSYQEVVTLAQKAVELSNAGKYAEAIPYLERSLEIAERVLDKDHPEVTMILNSLGLLYYKTGRYSEAESRYKRSLEIREKALGKDHPDVATVLDDLATLYYTTSRYAEAEPLSERSLEIKEKAYGREHPNLMVSLLALAIISEETQKYAQAISYAERLVPISEKALGRDRPEVAASLNILAVAYLQTTRYSEAETLFKRALEIQEKAFGKDDPNLSPTLVFLAVTYEKTGRYQEAISYAKRSLEINDKAFGKNNINVGRSLINLAELYRKTGSYAEAEPIYKRSLEIKEKVLGKDHPEVGVVLNNIALFYTQIRRYSEAEPLYKRSMEITEKHYGKNHPELAITLSNLAELYRQTFRFAESEMVYKRSLEIKEKNLGEDHPEVAIILNNLALLYEETDRYSEAEVLLKRSLEINERVLGKDHPDLATNLNNLAELYLNIGRYAEAEPLYTRSLEIRERVSGKEHPDYAASLNDLASFYLVTHQYAEAEVLAKETLEINEKALGKDSIEVAASLDILAWSYFETDRKDEAETLLKRSMGIKERLLEKDPLGIKGAYANSLTNSLNNLGALYISTDRYAEAEALLKRALDINEKIFGKDHIAVARILENLAFIYGKTAVIHGDTVKYSDAEVLLRRALDIREKVQGKDHPDVGLARNGMAILYAATDRHFESHRMFVDAITTAEKKREDIFSVLSERQKLNYMEQNRWIMNGMILHTAEYLQKYNLETAETFNAWLKWKGAVTEAQARYIDALAYSEIPEIQKRFIELNKTQREIARLQLSGLGKIELEEYRRRLQELDKTKEGIEVELSRLNKEFTFEKMAGKADIKKISEILLKDEKDSVYVDFAHVPISFWMREKASGTRYLAFVLLPGKEPKVKLFDLGDAEPIESHIKAYLKEMKRGKYGMLPREEILVKEAKTIHELLLKPIESYLEGKKQLYISPDGNLNLIPFEILMTPDGNYLMEDHLITYITAGRDIIKFLDTATAKGEPLIMADPDYDMGLDEKVKVAKALGVAETRMVGSISRDASDLRFERLPDTKIEADAIEKVLKEGQEANVRNYQDKNALEEVLLSVKEPKILHLATHGYFLKDEEVKSQLWMGFASRERDKMVDIGIENPMLRSGIVLAGANASLKEGKDEGMVSADKILGLRLHGTDLVVLSACETGVGDVKSGEGVFGLKRSFILSGAKTVVMSLWSVPSRETTELMVDFYTLMARGKTKAEALREAKLKLMKEKSNPFYWGAFVMVGNPN